MGWSWTVILLDEFDWRYVGASKDERIDSACSLIEGLGFPRPVVEAKWIYGVVLRCDRLSMNKAVIDVFRKSCDDAYGYMDTTTHIVSLLGGDDGQVQVPKLGEKPKRVGVRWSLGSSDPLTVALALAFHRHGRGGSGATDEMLAAVARDVIDSLSVAWMRDVLRARRDRLEQGELRSAYNDACDRLDVLASKMET